MAGVKLAGWTCFLRLMFALGTVLLFISPPTIAQDGYLTFTQVLTDSIDDVDGLSGVRSIAISPDGKHIYAAAKGDFSVALFQRNPSSGNITFVDLWRDGVGGVEGLDGAQFVTVSPDGNNVYVTSSSDHAVAVFGREITDGRLTFIEWIDVGELWGGRNEDGFSGNVGAFHVTVSPDGKDVYVSVLYDSGFSIGDISGISHFRRSLADGRLTSKGMY